jgi:hypothetical protein
MATRKNSKQTVPTKLVNATGLDSIAELVNNKRKLFWLNARTGFARGFFGVIGAGIAVLFISFLVSQLGWLPVVGEFFQKLGSAI